MRAALTPAAARITIPSKHLDRLVHPTVLWPCLTPTSNTAIRLVRVAGGESACVERAVGIVSVQPSSAAPRLVRCSWTGVESACSS